MDVKFYRKIKRLISKLYTLEKIANYKNQDFSLESSDSLRLKKGELLAQKLFSKIRCYTEDTEELISIDQGLWNRLATSKNFSYSFVLKKKQRLKNKIYSELLGEKEVPYGVRKFISAKFF